METVRALEPKAATTAGSSRTYAIYHHYYAVEGVFTITNRYCCIQDEEQTQMAIWALAAAPLFMSTDLQNVPASSKAILLNRELLQISQDPLGRAGQRFYHDVESGRQGWLRELANGDVAVALHNGGGNCSIPTWAQPVPPRCHGNNSLQPVCD